MSGTPQHTTIANTAASFRPTGFSTLSHGPDPILTMHLRIEIFNHISTPPRQILFLFAFEAKIFELSMGNTFGNLFKISSGEKAMEEVLV